MNDKISRMVKTLWDWNENVIPSKDMPEGLFGHTVVAECNGVKINSSELDIEFKVPFDDDIEANEAEIKIYNLSKTTISAFALDKKITLMAGYGNDTGVIFSGFVSKVSSKYSGIDKITVINAIDSVELKERKIESLSYSKGIKASYILEDLIKKINLPLAVFEIRKDHVYKDAVTVDGELMSNIKKYAEICGVSAYILKSQIYVRYIKSGDNINFTVCEDTGLLNSPEEFTEEEKQAEYDNNKKDNGKATITGYKFKMLLQHRLTTAAIIKLKSREINGDYRVRKGSHSYNGTDFITEVEVI